MTEPRSDKTAILAALGRARHLRDDPPPPILADVLAAPLCGPDVDAMIDEAIPIIGRSLTFVVRARYTEDRLKAARARGIGQYVILGAGLDTFAYRHRDHLDGLAVFEVDQPEMQAWKRQRVADVGLDVPPELVYIAVDFETEALGLALVRGGVRGGTRTVFSWLGVTQYLSREAIESTLRILATWPAGSETVLTYMPPQEQWGEGEPGARAGEKTVKEHGNPWRSFFTGEEITTLALSCGFSRVEHFGSDDASAAYFCDRTDGLRPLYAERLMAAIV